MNTVTVFLLFVGFAVATAAFQNDTEKRHISFEFETQREVKYEERISEKITRHKRATCDLLSVDTKLGSLNHSACATHCLTLRKEFKGGRCVDGVCNCRR